MTEVMVTQGANGALSSFINAFCNKGDEVVTFCPTYPSYLDHTEMSGATIKTVPLKLQAGKWSFDPIELRKVLIRPQTKAFIFNSPHNPTGKVFSRDEIKTISDILDDCP